MTTPLYHRDDPCPAKCGGFLGIRATGPDVEGLRTRYFKCRKCGEKVSCEIPSDSVRPRSPVVSNNETDTGNIDTQIPERITSNIETQDLTGRVASDDDPQV